MSDKLEAVGIESLIQDYEDVSSMHGKATEGGDHKAANEAHDKIAAIYRELRRRGMSAQRALLPLLSNDDDGVKLWSASHALEFAPEKGEPVLAQLETHSQGLLGFTAGMTLQQWRSGGLQFP